MNEIVEAQIGQFRVWEQVTEFYVTPSGHQFTLERAAREIPANEQTEPGFDASTAALLRDQEEQIARNAKPTAHDREGYILGGLVVGVIAGVLDDASRFESHPIEQIVVGTAVFGLASLICELRLRMRASRAYDRYATRDADIVKNIRR